MSMGRGHNHYDSCGCGWCCSTGRFNRSDRVELRRIMASRDAKRILKEQSASQGRAACFINPNASCPVCQSQVLYYQNEHGSRVFFDYPWKKHPCTDNGREVHLRAPKPTLRPRGLRLELVAAASSLGLYKGARFNQSGFPIDWQLLHVITVRRNGRLVLVEGKLIEMAVEPVVFLAIDSPDEILEERDFLYACYSSISLLNKEKLEARAHRVKWFTDASFREEIGTGEHDIEPFGREPSDASERVASRAIQSTLIKRKDYDRAKARTLGAKPTLVDPPKPKAKSPKKGRTPRAASVRAKGTGQLKREEAVSKVIVETKLARKHRRSPADGRSR